jgi:hypothetical protein
MDVDSEFEEPTPERLQELTTSFLNWLTSSEAAARIMRSYGFSPQTVAPTTLDEFHAAIGSTNYREHLVEAYSDDRGFPFLTFAERVTLAYKPEVAAHRIRTHPRTFNLE